MSDKVCAIVGAGPGISMAVAQRFGREGYKIALIARRSDKLNDYIRALSEQDITAESFEADAGVIESLNSVFEQIKSKLGIVDVLIYNAAVTRQGNASTLELNTLMDDFKVNVGGALISSQQVIPDMRVMGQGTILFTGGGLALNPYPDRAALAIGKAALRNLAYSLGAELESEGIFVGTVTIAGFVQPGTHFDPDLIAEKYWLLHTEHKEREIVYN